MKKLLFINVLCLLTVCTKAQRFEDYFEDRTLRLDYTFAGNDVLHEIYVDELVSLPHKQCYPLSFCHRKLLRSQ